MMVKMMVVMVMIPVGQAMMVKMTMMMVVVVMVVVVVKLMVMVMMPRVCGAGNDGRVPWRGLITLECRITTAREETSNLPGST